MPTTEDGPPSSALWTLRIFDAVPLPPALVGLLGLGVYLAVYFAYFAAFGRLDDVAMAAPHFWTQPGWWSELVNAAWIVYVATLIVYGLRGAARDLRDLRPALDCSEPEFRDLTARIAGPDRRALLVAGVISAALAARIPIFEERIWTEGVRPPVWDPLFLWVMGRHLLIGWLLGRAVWIDIFVTREFQRIGAERVRVDLLDPAPLAPFSRRGLRTVLLYVIGMSIMSLFWLGPHYASANASVMIVILLAASAMFVVPVLGVHRRLRETKRDELRDLRAEIRSAQAALRKRGTQGAREAARRLPALLALETRIASVREWPFDVSTLLRFGLYLSLGIGSWLGGALVERLLGLALD